MASIDLAAAAAYTAMCKELASMSVFEMINLKSLYHQGTLYADLNDTYKQRLLRIAKAVIAAELKQVQ